MTKLSKRIVDKAEPAEMAYFVWDGEPADLDALAAMLRGQFESDVPPYLNERRQFRLCGEDDGKRVRAGDAALNGSYVANGVHRFVTGQYAAGHEWGFMLGYVLSLPVKDFVAFINTRLRKVYGDPAGLTPGTKHQASIAVLESAVTQSGHHTLRLKHVFVDMLAAA